MRYRHWIIFGYLLLAFCMGNSQEYLATARHYGVKEGLSHREVYCIHKDQQGFIWFGTKYGLNKFDGYDFSWYSKEKHNLASNTVHHILEDQANRLWLFEGDNWYYKNPHVYVSIFDPLTEQVLPLSQIPGLSQHLIPRRVSGFVNSPQKSIYLSKDDKLIVFNTYTGLKEYAIESSSPIGIQYYDQNNHIWGFSEDLELAKIDTLGHVLDRYSIKDYLAFEDRVKILGMQEELLIFSIFDNNPSANRGIHNFRLFSLSPTGEIQLIPFPSSLQAHSSSDWGSDILYQAENHSFWYKGQPKLLSFNESGLLYDLGQIFPEIGNSQIHQVFFEQNNRIWISNNEGVYQIDLNSNPFQRMVFQPSATSSSDWISCRGLYQDGNFLYTNSYKGVFKIDLQTLEKQRLAYIPTVHKGESDLIFFDPLAILKGKDGSLWFGEERLIRKILTNR